MILIIFWCYTTFWRN